MGKAGRIGLRVGPITAACDHGVLTIAVPKAESVAPHTAEGPVVSTASEDGDGTLNAVFAEVPISVFPKPSLGKVCCVRAYAECFYTAFTASCCAVCGAPTGPCPMPCWRVPCTLRTLGTPPVR